jgi:hypothetical protein
MEPWKSTSREELFSFFPKYAQTARGVSLTKTESKIPNDLTIVATKKQSSRVPVDTFRDKSNGPVAE